MIAYRQQNNTPGVGIIVSVLLHSVVFGLLIFLAAREGMLGRELRKIAVTLVPRPKQMEPVKPIEKPATVPTPQIAVLQPPPKVNPVVSPPPARETIQNEVLAPPPNPAIEAPRLAAPPPSAIPALEFGGARLVETASDPTVLYRSYVEYVFRANWTRPANLRDQTYVAEVEVEID